MNTYILDILNHCIDTYERRGIYIDTEKENRQGIFLYVEKLFPAYADNFDAGTYQRVNEAIEYLRQRGILQGEKDARGNYRRLRYDLATIDRCYELAGRTALGETRREMLAILTGWDVEGYEILARFRTAQTERLRKNKSLEHGLGDDAQKLRDVTKALSALVRLESETYIRNFSAALFSDSKYFQKLRGCVESILCAYGDADLTRKTVLSTFNLLDNPTYILLKGRLDITIGGQTIRLAEIPGGIAFPSAGIPAIESVLLLGPALITVENLTTFHDEPEDENAIIYLGGFHNSVRTQLLKTIYSDNPDKRYFHKGDIDVYGFLILENLKAKTGIPFSPLGMDLATLQEYENYHLVQPLSATDKKMMQLPQLAPYQDMLSYMERHDCKAEQESQQALSLIQTEHRK